MVRVASKMPALMYKVVAGPPPIVTTGFASSNSFGCMVRVIVLPTFAVELLLLYLEHSTDVRIATLLIATENEASLALAEQTGFVAQSKAPLDQNIYFKRAVRVTKP